jgi:hypothetical protein
MEERKEEKHDCKSKFQVYEIFEVINSIRPVSVQMLSTRLSKVTHHLETFETIMKHLTLNA